MSSLSLRCGWVIRIANRAFVSGRALDTTTEKDIQKALQNLVRFTLMIVDQLLITFLSVDRPILTFNCTSSIGESIMCAIW